MTDDEDLYAHVDAVCAVPLTDDQIRAHHNSWADRDPWRKGLDPDEPIPGYIRLHAEGARRIHAYLGQVTYKFREADRG